MKSETIGALSLATKRINKAGQYALRRNKNKHIEKAQKLIAKASRYEGKMFTLSRDVNKYGWCRPLIQESGNDNPIHQLQ